MQGGLTYREVHYLAESMAETGRLSSVEVVEVNATDAAKVVSVNNTVGAQTTVRLAVDFITSALGKQIV